MEILFLVLGGALSWLITHYYHKKADKEAPEWAKPLFNMLPESKPNEAELIDLVKKFISEEDDIEFGDNANGEYIRYSNGDLTCKGRFTSQADFSENDIIITFPAAFSDNPALDLDGDISLVQSKASKPTHFQLKLKPTTEPKTVVFSYVARGRWK
ncbi:MAG: hypothetical protein AB7E13_02320 [Arcobacteraceae bacterium]|jgi:hypothetical protein